VLRSWFMSDSRRALLAGSRLAVPPARNAHLRTGQIKELNALAVFEVGQPCIAHFCATAQIKVCEVLTILEVGQPHVAHLGIAQIKLLNGLCLTTPDFEAVVRQDEVCPKTLAVWVRHPGRNRTDELEHDSGDDKANVANGGYNKPQDARQ
jgi:hypothetical protein